MRVLTRLLSMVTVAMCIVVLYADAASASRSLLVEPGGTFRAPSSGSVTFEEASLRLVNVRCLLTLGGALTNVGIAKSLARSLPAGVIAAIREASSSGCTESLGGAAEMSVLVEPARPFDVRYEAFLGTLPGITGISVTALRFKLQVRWFSGGICLYEADLPVLVATPGEAGNPVTLIETTRFRLVSGASCPEQGTFRGALTMRPAQAMALSTAALGVGGRLRGEPSPMRFRAEQRTRALILTNTGDLPVLVTSILLNQSSGSTSASREALCERLLPGERCLVEVTINERPASGEVIVAFRDPVNATEIRVRYEAP